MIYDSEIVTAIYQGLETLGDTNQMIHDFWVSELYDENDEPIPHMWSGDTLKQIETDVMDQLSDYDAPDVECVMEIDYTTQQ
jgi:hypothetical protein